MNLFPCLVTAPGGAVYETCRVTAGPDGTRVYWWDPQLGDARLVVASLDGQPVERARGARQYTVATPTGSATIIRSGGCGCGHPMKSWQLPAPHRQGS